MPHRIRLRTAWNRTIGSLETQRVDLPDTPLEPIGDDATVTYRRTFNCPTGLDDGSRVDLVVDAWQGQLTLEFDDAVLAVGVAQSDAPLVCDISRRVAASHRVEVKLASVAGEAIGLGGIVSLEISDIDRTGGSIRDARPRP